MNWWAAWRAWRQERKLKRVSVDATLWSALMARYPYTRSLSAADRERLQVLVRLFLHDKAIHGAGGLEISAAVRLAIAIQACILVLDLGLDSYRGWVEVIVYPDEFVTRYEYVDEDGVVHQGTEAKSGEAWAGGPVVLSWADAVASGGADAYNVVIHEFAHKLDMLNGEPNGFPPLHVGMSRERWARAFEQAYAHFCDRLDAGEDTAIDEYAAESPAEFFAVLSEVFFEDPALLRDEYPAVYEQLVAYYRQDPGARAAAARVPPTPACVV